MKKCKGIGVFLCCSILLSACDSEIDTENSIDKNEISSISEMSSMAGDNIESGDNVISGGKFESDESIDVAALMYDVLPDEPPRHTEMECMVHMCTPSEELFSEGDPAYGITEWSTEQTQIGAPRGICAIEGRLYVCDYENNCVVELDENGNFMEQHGTLGSEPGNFLQPTAILLYEDSLYVLDQGNKRIQIFDKEMNFEKEISYTGAYFSGDEECMSDIAIDKNGTIYLSCLSINPSQPYTYYLTEDGYLEKILPMMSGYLEEYQGEVYVVNTYIYWWTEYGFIRFTGQNFLFKGNTEHMEQLAEFPFRYNPGDFQIVDDMLYTVSIRGQGVQFNRITMDGKLDSVIQTIDFEMRGTYDSWYLEVVDDSLLYTADPIGGSVYKIQREE